MLGAPSPSAKLPAPALCSMLPADHASFCFQGHAAFLCCGVRVHISRLHQRRVRRDAAWILWPQREGRAAPSQRMESHTLKTKHGSAEAPVSSAQCLWCLKSFIRSPSSCSVPCATSLQSCLTLCDPMDCSLPGSSVHGILQARILESGLLCPPPGDLPDTGAEPAFLMSLVLVGGSLLLEPPGKLDREEGELSNLLKVTFLISVESGSEP